jgi:hypothetical protein
MCIGGIHSVFGDAGQSAQPFRGEIGVFSDCFLLLSLFLLFSFLSHTHTHVHTDLSSQDILQAAVNLRDVQDYLEATQWRESLRPVHADVTTEVTTCLVR